MATDVKCQQALGLRHIRTKPYTPRTNGKVERFIQTSLREWAYARSYESSEQRAAHLSLLLAKVCTKVYTDTLQKRQSPAFRGFA